MGVHSRCECFRFGTNYRGKGREGGGLVSVDGTDRTVDSALRRVHGVEEKGRGVFICGLP